MIWFTPGLVSGSVVIIHGYCEDVYFNNLMMYLLAMWGVYPERLPPLLFHVRCFNPVWVADSLSNKNELNVIVYRPCDRCSGIHQTS